METPDILKAKLPSPHNWKTSDAVENRASEPSDLNETLQAPAAMVWGECLPLVRNFASASSCASGPVAAALQGLLETS